MITTRDLLLYIIGCSMFCHACDEEYKACETAFNMIGKGEY